MRQKILPFPDHLSGLVKTELEKIKSEGLSVPPGMIGDQVEVEVKREKGMVEIGRVHVFQPTAPAQGQPGGSECE